MKKKNFYVLLLVIFVVGLIIIISTYVRYKKNYQVDSKVVDEVFEYFSTDDLEVCGGLFNYSNKLINYDDVDSKTKLCIAYYKVSKEEEKKDTLDKDKKKDVCKKDDMTFRLDDNEKKCSITKIGKETLNNEYKKLFGKDMEKDIKSFQADNLHICYIKDKNIICGLSETYTYVLGADINIYRVIEKTVEKSSGIEIYDYFIKVYNNECYSSYTTENVDSSCTKNINEKTKIKYKFLKKYGTLYKHIYEKNDDGSYHWVSSEPVKK